MRQDLKISFCITCKGRVHHLRHTLPINLAATANYPNVEFVILDYDSRDELEQWVQKNYMAEIAMGKIVYAKYEPAEHFHMTHAKNMAHRIASGDVLCNLDADNILAAGFASWLNTTFNTVQQAVVRINLIGRALLKYTNQTDRGMGGRIAVHSNMFYAVNGYNENIVGWDSDDLDFLARLTTQGARYKNTPITMLGSVIDHGDQERIEHIPPETRTASISRARALHKRRELPIHRHIIEALSNRQPPDIPPPANPDGNFGCGTVIKNFDAENPIVLEPIQPIRLELSSARPLRETVGTTR